MSLRSMHGLARVAILLVSALALSSTAALAQTAAYNSLSNLQAHLNTFGTFTRENLIYLVRAGYDGELTITDLYADILSDGEADARCQALINDLHGAPAAQRVTNIWVLHGVQTSQEEHRVCRGARE